MMTHILTHVNPFQRMSRLYEQKQAPSPSPRTQHAVQACPCTSTALLMAWVAAHIASIAPLPRDTSMHPGQWSSLWQTSLAFATVRHPLTRAVRSFERGSAAVAAAVAAMGMQAPTWEEFCHDPLVGLNGVAQ